MPKKESENSLKTQATPRQQVSENSPKMVEQIENEFSGSIWGFINPLGRLWKGRVVRSMAAKSDLR